VINILKGDKMNSIKPIDSNFDYTLQTTIQERLREIKRLKRMSKSAIKKSLYSLRHSSVQDANKKTADIIAVYDNTIRDIVIAVADICESAIQLGYTVDLDAFDKEDIEERYFSDGYLQCFSDIYRKFHELRGKM